MKKLKKRLAAGTAAVAAISTLFAGMTAPAYAVTTRQYGGYDLSDPSTWMQGDDTASAPKFLDQAWNRQFPVKQTGNDYHDSGCGAHTWANILLKSGYASEGYSAFDAGHHFSCPEHTAMNQEDHSACDKNDHGTDSDGSYSIAPSRYEGDSAKYITKIKDYGAPYAWNDINGSHDIDKTKYPSYTGQTQQYPSWITFKGWVRTDKDADLADNENLYFTESREIVSGKEPALSDCWSDDDDPRTPYEGKIDKINTHMMQKIRDYWKQGYLLTVSVSWFSHDTAGKDHYNGGHIMTVDNITADGTIELCDSGGGYRYLSEMLSDWTTQYLNGNKNSDGTYIKAHIKKIFLIKPAGIDSKNAPHFWDGDSISKAHEYINAHKKSTTITDDDYTYVLDKSMPVDSPDKKTKEPVAGWAFEDGTPGKKTKKGTISYSYVHTDPGKKYELKDTPDWYDREEQTKEGVPGKKDPRGNDPGVPAEPAIISYGYTTVKPNITYKLIMDHKPGKENETQTDPGEPGLVDSHCDDPNKSVIKAGKNAIVEYGPDPIPYHTEYRLDRSLEPDKTKTITPGVNGLRDPHATDETKHILKEPVTEVIGYGPNRIPFKIKYKWSESLPEGEEKTISPGKFGYIDQRHGNKELSKPVDEVRLYGPKRVPFETERVLDPQMPPNTEQTIQRGVVGLIGRDGKEIRPAKKKIVHYGPEEKVTPIDPVTPEPPAPDPAPEPGPKPEPGPSPAPEPGPKPQPGPAPEPGPKPEPGPAPEPGPKPNPQPGPAPEPGPKPQPEPGPAPAPTPDPNPVHPNPVTPPVTPVPAPPQPKDGDIPFGIDYQRDDTLEPGKTRLVRPGVVGRRKDGKIIQAPVNEVLAYGPIHGTAPVIYRADKSLGIGNRHINNAGTDPLYDPNGKLVQEGVTYDTSLGTDGQFLTIPDKISFAMSKDLVGADITNTEFKYIKHSNLDFIKVYNALDGKPATETPFNDNVHDKPAAITANGSVFDMSLNLPRFTRGTEVTIDKAYVGIPDGQDNVFVTMKDADGKTYRVPVIQNDTDSFVIRLDRFGQFMFADHKAAKFDTLPVITVNMPKETPTTNPDKDITVTPPAPKPIDNPHTVYVTSDQRERGIASRTYLYDPTTHLTYTNDGTHRTVIVRQASPIAFAREQDKDPSNDLVGDGHGHFYTVKNHPANIVVQRVAPMIRKLNKIANSVAPSAPRKQVNPPAPKPIIVHRNNPIQQKISNALNNAGSSTKPAQRNFETPEKDKKDDSTDKKDDKSKDSTDKTKDDKKDDKKDDSKKDDNSSTVPDNKSTEPSHDKTGDYSVSMKNKDPKMKDTDKQVKSVKKKQNSGSLVWTIVIIFVVLGAAAAGGFWWYKKRQEEY